MAAITIPTAASEASDADVPHSGSSLRQNREARTRQARGERQKSKSHQPTKLTELVLTEKAPTRIELRLKQVKAAQQQNEQYSRNDGDAGVIRGSHGHWLQ